MSFKDYLGDEKSSELSEKREVRTPDLNSIGQARRDKALPKILKKVGKFEDQLIKLQLQLEMGGDILVDVNDLAGVSAKAKKDLKDTLKLLKDAQNIIGNIEYNL